ncbi:hypothetical protein [Spirillospora sp. NPDC029432]|uniref:hypothetical protein n=1 Tax=Spirillospora sp. NPDC029432 TaxID=3154599 RepID=UPI0034545FDF
MLHSEIMYAVKQDRARDLRARARNERAAGAARRSLRFWADEAAQRSERRVVKRAARARGAAHAAGR